MFNELLKKNTATIIRYGVIFFLGLLAKYFKLDFLDSPTLADALVNGILEIFGVVAGIVTVYFGLKGNAKAVKIENVAKEVAPATVAQIKKN